LKPKPGDVITVKVGGKEYDTVIDEQGVQRFKENGVLKYLFDRGALDLNEIARIYHTKKPFSQRDYAELNMMLGYSVSGWCDLSAFQDMDVKNPLWENK
jgi:hypothetical protein